MRGWSWLMLPLLLMEVVGDFIPSMMYISYSEDIPLSSQRMAPSDQPNVTGYSDLMQVDDSPFSTVQVRNIFLCLLSR